MIVGSISIGCLLGGFNGIVLILSPIYLHKQSYSLFVIFIVLILTGSFSKEDIIQKSMLMINNCHVLYNTVLKRRD